MAQQTLLPILSLLKILIFCSSQLFFAVIKKYGIKILFLIAEFFGAPLILCPSPGPSPMAGLLTFPQGKTCPSLSFYICEMGIVTLTPQSCQACWVKFYRREACFVNDELCDSRRLLSVLMQQGHPGGAGRGGLPLAELGVL